MTAPRYATSTKGTLPWSGSSSSNHYGKADIGTKWHGPLAELHVRRSDDELEELLAERLAQLRAKPPFGYPHPDRETAA